MPYAQLWLGYRGESKRGAVRGCDQGFGVVLVPGGGSATKGKPNPPVP